MKIISLIFLKPQNKKLSNFPEALESVMCNVIKLRLNSFSFRGFLSQKAYVCTLFHIIDHTCNWTMYLKHQPCDVIKMR